jgi:hypothetical protein
MFVNNDRVLWEEEEEEEDDDEEEEERKEDVEDDEARRKRRMRKMVMLLEYLEYSSVSLAFNSQETKDHGTKSQGMKSRVKLLNITMLQYKGGSFNARKPYLMLSWYLGGSIQPR